MIKTDRERRQRRCGLFIIDRSKPKMGLLKRYKTARKDKSLKSLIWFDKWLLICFGFSEIRDIREEVEWLRGALIDEEGGSDSGGESEHDEEESEDEEFENEVAEAEDDAPEVDGDDDEQEMDICEDEMAENNKDFEDMEQPYVDGDENDIDEKDDEGHDDQMDSIVDSEIGAIDDKILEDEEYDAISGKSSFSLLRNKPAIMIHKDHRHKATDTIIELDENYNLEISSHDQNNDFVSTGKISEESEKRKAISPRILRNEAIKRDVKPGILVAIFTNTFAKGPKRQASIKGLRRSKSQGPASRKKSAELAEKIKTTKSVDNLSALRLSKNSYLKNEKAGEENSDSESSSEGSIGKEEQIMADLRAEIDEIEQLGDECESEDDDYEDDEEQDQFLNAIEREIEDQEVCDNYY
ncbi:unnamed protein product [Oikopleura dioica]|uniref:Uncharacterized protein n=2 Tax=Oikopleura dioica TaxID=34765 RepID=E4XNW0_OIKDI|nr:unnamed protein product [Oikopleura dioica]